MNTQFSPERIANALNDFRALLNGDRREPLVTLHALPNYRAETDPEVMVEKACAQIRADAASQEPHVLPTFWADFGTVSTAKLWGGKVIPAPENGGVHIEPVACTLADVENLAVCQSFEQSDYQQAITLYRRICERLETDQVFIRTPDFQGPMNTLALLVDQTELMCGLYEEPELIERALDHVTDTLIAHVQRFREEIGADKVIGNIWPFTSLPDGKGVGITQDYMPLLRPEHYAHFEIPRLKRIADAFGGVFIHCCGEYERHLPTLAKADFKIWGIEAHYPCTKLWNVYDALGDKMLYTPYVMNTAEKEFPTPASFCKELAKHDCAKARLWFCGCLGWWDADELRRTITDCFQ